MTDHDTRKLSELAHAWLVRLRSDKVTTDDRRAFESWLSEDPAHARAYQQAEHLWDMLHAPALHIARRPPARTLLSPAWASGLAVAAMLMLALMPYSLERLRPWRADAVTGWGETRVLTLTDGSSVTLGSHTSLDLSAGGNTRHLRLLEGEAYFEVAKDPAHPFVVDAGEGRVTVLGTHFDVRADSGPVAVTVTEGHVRVDSGTDSMILSPGQRTVYEDNHVAVPQLVDMTDNLAWLQGRIVFKLEPLVNVVEEINRYTADKIVIADPMIRQRVVSGVFTANQPQQSLEIITETLRVNSLRLPGGVTVLYRKL